MNDPKVKVKDLTDAELQRYIDWLEKKLQAAKDESRKRSRKK